MAIRTINPGDAYNKGKFVGAMKDFTQLGGDLEKISSADGNWNPSVRKDLGNLLRDNQTFYAGLQPDSVIDDTENCYSGLQDNVVKYTKNNFNELLNKIKDQNLLNLVLGLPLKESDTIRVKKIKQVIKAINEKRKIEKITQEGGAENYVMEKLANASDWRKQAYLGYSIGNPDYTQRTFQAYAQSAEVSFREAITTSDGKKIDAPLLREVLRESYKAIDTSTDEGKNLAKVFQINIAQTAYREVK
jgi:hypothetical protein